MGCLVGWPVHGALIGKDLFCGLRPERHFCHWSNLLCLLHRQAALLGVLLGIVRWLHPAHKAPHAAGSTLHLSWPALNIGPFAHRQCVAPCCMELCIAGGMQRASTCCSGYCYACSWLEACSVVLVERLACQVHVLAPGGSTLEVHRAPGGGENAAAARGLHHR